MDDGFQMQFLGCKQWKTIRQVKPHLVAKYAPGARSGAVAFVVAGINNML